MTTIDSTCPIRVSSGALPPGTVVRGNEGFMRLNMELDFVNRSTVGRHCAVVAKSFGAVGVGHIDGARRRASCAHAGISATGAT